MRGYGTPVAREEYDPEVLDIYFREIDGVGLLTAREEVALAQAIEEGDLQARDALLTANLRLVIHVAGRYYGNGVPFPDLIQAGNVGLLRAVKKFDWRKGHRFSTYATWWIRQGIQRGIADMGRPTRLPEHFRERQIGIMKVRKELELALDRPPTWGEVAVACALTTEQVRAAMNAEKQATSLDAPSTRHNGYGDGAGSATVGEMIPDPDADLERVTEESLRHDEVLAVVNAVLPERYALVLRLRFGFEDGDEWTLTEIGNALKVSRERIRQLEKKALERLRQADVAAVLAAYRESA